MATTKTKHWARRPFRYGRDQLDRGQVFSLAGAVNDEKLVRIGFVAELTGKPETYTCAECGAEFIGEAERRGHGDKRHRLTVLTPMEEDALLAREERMLEQTAPLYLDQTAAARAA